MVMGPLTEEVFSAIESKSDKPLQKKAAIIHDFQPSPDRVDFTKIKDVRGVVSLSPTFDIAASEEQPFIYKAVAAGQIEELMEFLNKKGDHLTKADCLLMPDSNQPSLIELVMAQDKLAIVITVENWKHDPQGLQNILSNLPSDELEQQLPDLHDIKVRSSITSLQDPTDTSPTASAGL